MRRKWIGIEVLFDKNKISDTAALRMWWNPHTLSEQKPECIMTLPFNAKDGVEH